MRDSAPHPSHVHFSVITPDNVVYTLSMHTFTTIRGLKDELAKQSGIPSHRQSLILSDCLLRDGRTISNYKLQNRDLIHLHTTGSSGFTIPDDPVATAVPATGAQPVPVNPRAGSRGYDNGDDDDNDNDSVTTMSSAEHAGVMRFRFADVCEDVSLQSFLFFTILQLMPSRVSNITTTSSVTSRTLVFGPWSIMPLAIGRCLNRSYVTTRYCSAWVKALTVYYRHLNFGVWSLVPCYCDKLLDRTVRCGQWTGCRLYRDLTV